MMELLNSPFMQRALIAAVLVGITAPAVGIYLVQRRQALMGDGIGHVAMTGVGLGFLLSTSPVWMATLVSVLGAVTMELIRWYGKTRGDIALAMLFYGGMAGGVLFINLAPGGSTANLSSYLFGSLSTVSPSDVWAIGLLAAFVLAGDGRPAPPALRGQPGRGVRAGDGSAGARPEPSDGRHGGGHGDGRDAGGRPAAGERTDGGAGRGRPAAVPQLRR